MSDLVCGSPAFIKQLKTDSVLHSGKQAVVLCGWPKLPLTWCLEFVLTKTLPS